MSNLALEKLKDLIDANALLSLLGFRIYYENDFEIRAPCLIHGGDNKTAFSFRKATKRFYCFSHGCEIDSSGKPDNDVISLVMKVKRLSFKESVLFLSDLTGFDALVGDTDLEAERQAFKDKDKDKFVKAIISNSSIESLDETLVDEYRGNGCKYFESLGFSKRIIDLFELGTMVDEFGVERAAIPIRDDMGRLVGISGRRINGNEEPRYKLTKKFKKGKVLYNLNNALNFKSLYNHTIVIVEGFKASWHVVSSGFDSVAAVMGRTITQDQINLLVRHGYNNVILLLDGDENGVTGTKRSIDLLRGKIDVRPIYLPQDKSPDDIPIKDLYEVITSFV